MESSPTPITSNEGKKYYKKKDVIDYFAKKGNIDINSNEYKKYLKSYNITFNKEEKGSIYINSSTNNIPIKFTDYLYGSGIYGHYVGIDLIPTIEFLSLFDAVFNSAFKFLKEVHGLDDDVIVASKQDITRNFTFANIVYNFKDLQEIKLNPLLSFGVPNDAHKQIYENKKEDGASLFKLIDKNRENNIYTLKFKTIGYNSFIYHESKKKGASIDIKFNLNITYNHPVNSKDMDPVGFILRNNLFDLSDTIVKSRTSITELDDSPLLYIENESILAKYCKVYHTDIKLVKEYHKTYPRPNTALWKKFKFLKQYRPNKPIKSMYYSDGESESESDDESIKKKLTYEQDTENDTDEYQSDSVLSKKKRDVKKKYEDSDDEKPKKKKDVKKKYEDSEQDDSENDQPKKKKDIKKKYEDSEQDDSETDQPKTKKDAKKKEEYEKDDSNDEKPKKKKDVKKKYEDSEQEYSNDEKPKKKKDVKKKYEDYEKDDSETDRPKKKKDVKKKYEDYEKDDSETDRPKKKKDVKKKEINEEIEEELNEEKKKNTDYEDDRKKKENKKKSKNINFEDLEYIPFPINGK
jgi:hypothetical protein